MFNPFAGFEACFAEVVHLLEVQPELGLLPKYFASRSAVSDVMPRLPLIWLIRPGGTRRSDASRFWLIPSGTMNSSRNISPGEVVTLLIFHPVSGLFNIVSGAWLRRCLLASVWALPVSCGSRLCRAGCRTRLLSAPALPGR